MECENETTWSAQRWQNTSDEAMEGWILVLPLTGSAIIAGYSTICASDSPCVKQGRRWMGRGTVSMSWGNIHKSSEGHLASSKCSANISSAYTSNFYSHYNLCKHPFISSSFLCIFTLLTLCSTHLLYFPTKHSVTSPSQQTLHTRNHCSGLETTQD